GGMYEVLLQHLGKDRYQGACSRFRQEFDETRPEPPTGEQLMSCFNSQMDAMGMGCCDRQVEGFAFLTGTEDAFNHHPCQELERRKELQEFDRELIRAHCFKEGMFMAHSKDTTYGEESLKRAALLSRQEL
ncbi:unnamed protein product, partial [Effrenium voratum]